MDGMNWQRGMYVDLEECSQDEEFSMVVNPIDTLAEHDECCEEINVIEAEVENGGNKSRGKGQTTKVSITVEMECVRRQKTQSKAEST